MDLIKMIEQIPLRECRAIPFRESLVQPFGGFEDAVKRTVQRFPCVELSIPIRIENQPDSVSISLVSRQHDEICRCELDIDNRIEEIGPFYLQIQR